MAKLNLKNKPYTPPTEFSEMMTELRDAMLMADGARHLQSLGQLRPGYDQWHVAQKALRQEAGERIYKIGLRLAETKGMVDERDAQAV